MGDYRYCGLLGNVAEATDIKNAIGCSSAEAFEIQSHVAAIRHQEYLDSIAEIELNNSVRVEGNVVWNVNFVAGKKRNDVARETL